MDIKKIIESLGPNELKVLPHIQEKNITSICKKSNLDKTSVLRALEYLKNKNLVELEYEKKQVIDLGINGILYKKKGLPERRLLDILGEKIILPMKEAQEQSKLSNEEFKISLGVLKNQKIIEIKNKKLILNSESKMQISKKSPEEIFLETLPLNYDSLSEIQKQVLKNFQKRKNIVKIKEEKKPEIKITKEGREIVNSGIKSENLIEFITPEILRKETAWKGKRFRRYDVISPVPGINGGKRHFVNQAADYARKIWTDMGFKEMAGNIVESSFWIFDSLFTPQDHPAREMQDTFFIDKKSELPDKKLVESVKKAHEEGVEGSRGWRYKWNPEIAKQIVLRTHTTGLSAITLSNLKKEDLPAKFFALGKALRNETVDWSHGFEFYQTEGIVVDKNANFRHLLGYLKEFYKKMGFKKIRFTPAYFPYTEPSVEINVFHPERKVWIELGGAGIFRPEITAPLLGESVPVLAWGQGFDRIIMDFYKIKDLRELYKNDIKQLREIKFWMK